MSAVPHRNGSAVMTKVRSLWDRDLGITCGVAVWSDWGEGYWHFVPGAWPETTGKDVNVEEMHHAMSNMLLNEQPSSQSDVSSDVSTDDESEVAEAARFLSNRIDKLRCASPMRLASCLVASLTSPLSPLPSSPPGLFALLRDACIQRLGARTFGELYDFLGQGGEDDDRIEDEESLKAILHNHPDWRDIARSIGQLIYCESVVYVAHTHLFALNLVGWLGEGGVKCVKLELGVDVALRATHRRRCVGCGRHGRIDARTGLRADVCLRRCEDERIICIRLG